MTDTDPSVAPTDTPEEPVAPEEPTAPVEEPAPEAPAEPEPGDREAIESQQAEHAANLETIAQDTAAYHASTEPWVKVASIPAGQTVPQASTGEDAEYHVTTNDGVSFFHTLATLPAHLKDAVGNVIFGQHIKTTIDGPVPPEAPPESPEPPA
jgi:hypothetical protein